MSSPLTEQLMDAYRSNIYRKMEAALLNVRRVEETLEAHRRYHNTVGCPGRPECQVCAAEEWMEQHWNSVPGFTSRELTPEEHTEARIKNATEGAVDAYDE